MERKHTCGMEKQAVVITTNISSIDFCFKSLIDLLFKQQPEESETKRK
jgi:hypothetical protein